MRELQHYAYIYISLSIHSIEEPGESEISQESMGRDGLFGSSQIGAAVICLTGRVLI